MGQNRSGLLIGIVFLGVLIGILGGAIMGGVAGYYVIRNSPAVMQSAPPAERVNAVAPTQAPAQSPARAPATQAITMTEDSAVIEAVKKVEPAVVTVISTISSQRGVRGTNQASGSGVVVDSQGYVITNNHVIDGARQIDLIFSDNTKQTAKLIGADPLSDIAVLKVDTVSAVVPFGDSNSLQLGQIAIAIGSPLGNYRGSVTRGVVSGVNRSVEGTNMEGLIQTDAAINHGNSGGPLINTAGEIIGINTLVVRDTQTGDIAEGLGFAVPSNTVKQVFQQLVAKGKIDYPYLGISYDLVTPQTAAEQNLPVQTGVLVTSVTAGTPAARAGVQQNDIITAINGIKIDADHSLRSVLFQFKPGDTLTLTIARGSQTLDIKLQAASRPSSTP